MQSKIILIVLACIALVLGIISASINPKQPIREVEIVPATRTEAMVTQTPTEGMVQVPQSVDMQIITQLLESRLHVAAGTLDVTLSTASGVYANGLVNKKGDEIDGGKWWAVYTENNWNIVHDGQDFPSCKDIEGMSFSKSMLPACIE